MVGLDVLVCRSFGGRGGEVLSPLLPFIAQIAGVPEGVPLTTAMLRGLRRSASGTPVISSMPNGAGERTEELVKLLGDLYQARTTDTPVLNTEEVRRRVAWVPADGAGARAGC